MKEETTNVLRLEQVPIISFGGLKGIGEFTRKRIAALNIDAQIATEDSLKSLKVMKTTLNKEFGGYEGMRKTIKSDLMNEYDKVFIPEYNEQLKEVYTDAISKLTDKIAFVEDDLKKKKKDALMEYFDEYCASVNIDFIKFENVGLNINRSASDNKLKKEISDYIDKVKKDLNLISTLSEDKDYTAEVAADFYITLDSTLSIANVNTARQRKAAIAEQQAVKVKQAPIVEPIKAPLQAPTIEVEDKEQRVMKASFTVKASIAKLRVLKQYMIDNNIEIL